VTRCPLHQANLSKARQKGFSFLYSHVIRYIALTLARLFGVSTLTRNFALLHARLWAIPRDSKLKNGLSIAYYAQSSFLFAFRAAFSGMCLFSRSSRDASCSLVSSGVVTWRAVQKQRNPSTSSGLGTMARGTGPASPVGCVPRWPAPSGSADMAGRKSSGRKVLHIANG
jgi:hypothetical protein